MGSKSRSKRATRDPVVMLTPFDPGQWHTIEEAAALLKVSPRRMRRWVYNRTVGSKLLPGGRGRRVSGAHLNAAMGLDDDEREGQA
jgi:hypothetical protein